MTKAIRNRHREGHARRDPASARKVATDRVHINARRRPVLSERAVMRDLIPGGESIPNGGNPAHAPDPYSVSMVARTDTSC
jgi:hypothetical protein